MNVLSSDELINFSKVDFAYEGENLVLEQINLSIPRGEFACIVGPNGGGKTTLLKLILGLLKPTAGKVEIFGYPPHESLDKIGYVPQQSHFDSSFPVSLTDVVLMGCLNNKFRWGSYSAEQKDRARSVIEEVGLTDFADHGFAELSGGQRQRALVARAMVSKPELLLMDEPTSNIDVQGTDQLYRLFEELNKKFTIIMVSHDIGFVSKRVKSVICVRKNLQVHPVSELTGETMLDLYGSSVRAIRHDHRCSEGGHTCLHS
jgi:zinc transport system ATP-binding protein